MLTFLSKGTHPRRAPKPYNLRLSGYRADWVREVLIRKGIAKERILLAVPWGELYPACLDETEECHAKNRVVRFAYHPN